MVRIREMELSACIENLVKLSLKRNAKDIDVKFALSAGTFGVQDTSEELTQCEFPTFCDNIFQEDLITIEAVFVKAIEKFHKVIIRTKGFCLFVQDGKQIMNIPVCKITPTRGLWAYLQAYSGIKYKTNFVEDLKIFLSELALMHYKVTFRLIDLEAKEILAAYEGTSTLAERVAQIREIRYHDIHLDLFQHSFFKMEICFFFHEVLDKSNLDRIISKDGQRITDIESFISSKLIHRLTDMNFVGIIHHCEESNVNGYIYERCVALLEKLDSLSLKNYYKDNINLLLEEVDPDADKQLNEESNHIDLTTESPVKEKHSNTEYLMEFGESNEDLYYEVACSKDKHYYCNSEKELKQIFETWLTCTLSYPYEEEVIESESPKSTTKLSNSNVTPTIKGKGSALLALEASYSSMDRECKKSVHDSDINIALKKPTSLKSQLLSFDELMNYSKAILEPFPWRSDIKSNRQRDDDVIILDEPAAALPKFDSSFKIPRKTSVDKPQESLSLRSLSEDLSDIEIEDGGLQPLKKISFFEEQQKEYKRIEENNKSRIFNSTLIDPTELSSSLTCKPVPESISRILERRRLRDNFKSPNNSHYRNGADNSKDDFLGESSKSFSFKDDFDFGSEPKKFDLAKHEAVYNNSKESSSMIKKVKDGVSSFFSNFSFTDNKSGIDKEKSASEDDVSIVGVSYGAAEKPQKNGFIRKREREHEVSSTTLNEDDDVKVVEPERPKNKIFKTRTQSSRPTNSRDNDVVEVIDVDKDSDHYSRRSHESREREKDKRALERWRSRDSRDYARSSYRNNRNNRFRDSHDDRTTRENPMNNYYKRSRSPSRSRQSRYY